MTRHQIQNELIHRNVAFAEYILSLHHRDFTYAHSARWTAGQQLLHILKTTRAVLNALRLPRPLLRLAFGKLRRPSMDYRTLVKFYQELLVKGGKSPQVYIPSVVAYESAEALKEKLLVTITKINLKLDDFTEAQLDHYCLPHPLLGPLSIREMLYFTMYHVEHHMEKTKENLRYVGVVNR